jgi:hypothetical protein
MAPVNVVMLANSPGSGLASCAPGTGKISEPNAPWLRVSIDSPRTYSKVRSQLQRTLLALLVADPQRREAADGGQRDERQQPEREAPGSILDEPKAQTAIEVPTYASVLTIAKPAAACAGGNEPPTSDQNGPLIGSWPSARGSATRW